MDTLVNLEGCKENDVVMSSVYPIRPFSMNNVEYIVVVIRDYSIIITI